MEDDMTELVYRGVAYRKEDVQKQPQGDVQTLRYRGYEYDPRDAWKAARPIYTSRLARVYRGVRDDEGGPGGNAWAAV